MVQTRKDNEPHELIVELLSHLRKDHFFGIVELHFQKGEIVRAKKQENYEPKDFVSFRRTIN
jgi:ribonuclease BN (tRNA processing enzyme)